MFSFGGNNILSKHIIIIIIKKIYIYYYYKNISSIKTWKKLGGLNFKNIQSIKPEMFNSSKKFNILNTI